MDYQISKQKLDLFNKVLETNIATISNQLMGNGGVHAVLKVAKSGLTDDEIRQEAVNFVTREMSKIVSERLNRQLTLI